MVKCLSHVTALRKIVAARKCAMPHCNNFTVKLTYSIRVVPCSSRRAIGMRCFTLPVGMCASAAVIPGASAFTAVHNAVMLTKES